MKAVLRCDLDEHSQRWDTRLLERTVSGVPLLKRHLLAFREAGLREVQVRVFDDDQGGVADLLKKYPVEGIRAVVEPTSTLPGAETATLQQRADTLIDPRLIQQIVSMWGEGPASRWTGPLECVDQHRDNYPLEAKTPYKVGVPEKDEAALLQSRPVDPKLHPIGLDLKTGPPLKPACVDVGRYYWHRLEDVEDFKIATRKTLLATMKATDGIYARTNRRVSLLISRLLINTPVTPNAVTLFTLVCSLVAGLLYAKGEYGFMVAGAFLSWAASMLDGVDGELARSKFQASDFGCWLEMVCDYLYYVFVFSGIGYGLEAATGNPIWFYLGVASAVGSLIGFAVVAHQRKLYSSQGDAGEYGLAFQRRVGAQSKKSPVYAATRKLTFLATRAALPYYIFIFTVLGLAKALLVLIFVGTSLSCFFAAYVTSLFTSPAAE